MTEKRQKGLPMYPGSIKLYLILILLIIGESIAIIAQAYFLARAITNLFERMPINDVVTDIGFFFVAFLIRYLLTHVQSAAAEKYAIKTATMLRESVFHTYFHRAAGWTQKIGTGHIVTLAMEGVDHVKTYLEIIGIRMIKTFILPPLIVIFVYTYDKQSAFVLVAAVPIIIMFMILLGVAAQKMADKQYVTYKRLSNHFIDSLRGLETLAYLGKSKSHGKQIGRVSEEYRKATMRTLRIAFTSSFALDFFTSLSIAFVAVGLGLRLIDGTVILLPALTILILAPEYFSPIKQVGKDYHATLDGQMAMGEIDAFVTEDTSTPLAVNKTVPKWSATGELTFTNLSVTVEDKALLHGLSFTAKHGLNGIIGTSGAGKTTLLQVLAGRMQHTEGSITLSGQIVNTLHDASWSEQIAYIPQHPYIFPLSLANNIRFYQPDATDASVEELVDQIGLRDFVDTLPNGINEKIGEGGRILSGGQDQRIAIARALLSEKQVILLDEPTAHLDIETEYEVKQLVLRLFADKFVFLATHRLHWMKEMDHIYMLSAGELIASGTHETLMQEAGPYEQFLAWGRGENDA